MKFMSVALLPSYLLPNKMPWALDPFLDPLVIELEDIFIDGKLTNSLYVGTCACTVPLKCNVTHTREFFRVTSAC